jgi:hypothetical protein
MKNLHKKRQPKTAKSKHETVIIKYFYVKTHKPDEFIDKLEQLCVQYSQSNFSFKYSVED